MAFRQLYMQVGARCAVMQAFVTFAVHTFLAFFQLSNMLAPSSHRIFTAYAVHLEHRLPHGVNALFLRQISKDLVCPGTGRGFNERPADFVAARVILIFLACDCRSFHGCGDFGGINSAEQLRIWHFNM
ncbi:hypothetical protein D3C73_1209650 [compost metagenome]